MDLIKQYVYSPKYEAITDEVNYFFDEFKPQNNRHELIIT